MRASAIPGSRRFGGGPRVVAGVVALALSAPGRGIADEPRPAARIVIVAHDELFALARATLESELAPARVALEIVQARALDVHEVITPDPDAPRMLARAWVDLSGDASARVYLADATWSRMLMREVAAPRGPDLVAAEALAHIVVTAVDSLLAGETIGVAHEEAAAAILAANPPTTLPPISGTPPTLPPPPRARPRPRARPTPEPARPVTMGAALGYGVSAWSARHPPPHGPDARLHAELPIAGLWPRLGITATVRGPTGVDASPAGVELLTLTGAAEGSVALAGPLRVALGAGLRLVRSEPQDDDSTALALTGVEWHAEAVVRARVELELTVHGGLFVSPSLGADAAFERTSYVVVSSAGRTVVLTPWAITPSAALLVGWRADP